MAENVVTIGYNGYSVDYVEISCGNAPKCTRKATVGFASHGGDLFDPEYPPVCSVCMAEYAAAARMARSSGLDYETALDSDDLPFD